MYMQLRQLHDTVQGIPVAKKFKDADRLSDAVLSIEELYGDFIVAFGRAFLGPLLVSLIISGCCY